MRNILMIVIMGTIIGMGWYVSMKVPAEINKQFEETVSQGAAYEEKGFYLDAINSYNEALTIKNDTSVKKSIVMDYLAMEDYKSFEKEAVAYLKNEPDEEIYKNLIRYYFDSTNKESAGAYITAAEENYPESEAIHDLRTEFDGLFNLSYTEYSDVTEFIDGHAVAKVVTGETFDEESDIEVYYLLDNKGKKSIKDPFTVINDVKGMDEVKTGETNEKENIFGKVVVTGQLYEESKLVCLDEDGYNRAVDTDGFDYIGAEHDGKMLVKTDGKWMYMTNGATGAVYDDATAFQNGVAAVKKDGKWALIDTDENQITEFAYENVYTDYLKSCSRGGVIFAKKDVDSGFMLLDTLGNRIGTDTYEEVKGFLSDSGVAAVKRYGRWGAINTKGEIVIPFEHDEIGSSETGYIPYKDGDFWGYISPDGEVLIEAQFDEASGITKDGYGMVKEGDYWEIITIYSIKGDETIFDL